MLSADNIVLSTDSMMLSADNTNSYMITCYQLFFSRKLNTLLVYLNLDQIYDLNGLSHTLFIENVPLSYQNTGKTCLR
jgi:hypothetical protein